MITHTFRVSRYSSDLAARRADWSSISDVGASFHGEVLTQQTYEQVEQRYLDAARRFLADSNIDRLSVLDVDWTADVPLARREIADRPFVTPDEAIAICRLQLREDLSCRLESPDRFYLHFGFDLYMYIGSWTECAEAVQHTVADGLFVEHDVTSPYLNE